MALGRRRGLSQTRARPGPHMLARMRQFAVSAIGPDRPGLVASMTRCLTEGGLNVADAQMTILRGRFTMTLMATSDDSVDVAAVRSDLEATGRRVGLDVVAINEVDEADAAALAPPAPTHVLTVHGVDRPGVIHAFSEALAVHEVNIADLHQRKLESREGDDELAAMLVEVILPEGMTSGALDALLESTRREQGIEISIRPADDGPE
jgi:glycine cleavage system transcriptional repressor